MKSTKITGENPIQGGLYAANASKENGNTLDASEWNNISGAVYTAHSKINDLVDDMEATQAAVSQSANSGTGLPSGIADNFELSGSDNNNMTIKSAKHLNLEPSYKTYDSTNGTWSDDNLGDLLLKPGDDISLYSHHRAADKRDEVSVKILDENDHPVKLLIQAGELTLLAKQKNLTKVKNSTTGKDNAGSEDSDYLYKDDQAGVFDINVTKEYKPNRGSDAKVSGKGYLKVRAQAIDLRCEEHGGIALQPKGEDGQGHQNKIKFEHGGGDGLEFGTFNAEKTSIYTDEYRFKKDGVWKMATRDKNSNIPGSTGNGKYVQNDPTTHFSYQKQADDFYDIISSSDDVCTTEDIINTAAVLNGNNRITTKINGDDFSVTANETYRFTYTSQVQATGFNTSTPYYYEMQYADKIIDGKCYTVDQLYHFFGQAGENEFPFSDNESSRTVYVYSGGSKIDVWTVDKVSDPSINLLSHNYKFLTNGVWSAGRYNGTAVGTVRATTENIINTAKTFNTNDVQCDGTKLSLYENSTFSVLSLDNAIAYSKVPAGFMSQVYSNHIFTGIDSFVVNNVTGTDITISSWQDFASGIGLSVTDIENLSDFHLNEFVFAITSVSDLSEADNTNTKIIVVTNHSIECNAADIIKLVNYFKNGAGQADGPWANV